MKRTPLKRKTELKAGAQLQRGEYQRKPKRQTRQEVKQASEARISVAMRSRGVCEARIPGVCLGRATNYHHRLPRGQGGTDTPACLMHLCGSGTTGCHGWVEHNRALSYELGLLVRMGQDPAKNPVSPLPWRNDRV